MSVCEAIHKGGPGRLCALWWREHTLGKPGALHWPHVLTMVANSHRWSGPLVNPGAVPECIAQNRAALCGALTSVQRHCTTRRFQLKTPCCFSAVPAKSLDYDTPVPESLPHTRPQFVPQSTALIEVLREKSVQGASLMALSDTLAALNVARYQVWKPQFTASNSRQAVLAFNGDVYEGLQARSLSAEDLDWAQRHVAILSGLYGVLRPLDRMQPLPPGNGYAAGHYGGQHPVPVLGSQIAEYLNTQLRSDTTPVIVNLASQEYFKAVDRKALKARVIECVFEDWKVAPTRSSASTPSARGG